MFYTFRPRCPDFLPLGTASVHKPFTLLGCLQEVLTWLILLDYYSQSGNFYGNMPVRSRCFWHSSAATVSDLRRFRSSVMTFFVCENTRSHSALIAGQLNKSKAILERIG
ncbi:Uncharacterized protein HZ326_30779 [Fusarium oxysporum f. sp. albedinis]|nr:Uncharacterized protein HZ326_30779 [Fusarium oxysporum f. sp. albedinis]